MPFAEIYDGRVFALHGERPPFPEGVLIVEAGREVRVGWTYDGSDFAAPAPRPVLVPNVISDRQFAQGLWNEGLITYEEYLAFVGPGTIPPALLTILRTLPDDDTGTPTPRKIAIGLVTGAKEYLRSNPLVDTIRQAHGWTSQQLDDRWIAWAAL